MAGQGVSSEQWEARGQCEGSSGKVAQACACAFLSLWAVAPNKPVPWLEQAGCGPLIMDTLCPPLTPASLTPWCLSLGDPGIGLGMSCPPQPSAPRSSPPRRGPRQSRGCQLTGPTPCHLFSVALGSLVLDPGQHVYPRPLVFNRAPGGPHPQLPHPESRDFEPSRLGIHPVSC